MACDYRTGQGCLVSSSGNNNNSTPKRVVKRLLEQDFLFRGEAAQR
jgi:hypothetical protein